MAEIGFCVVLKYSYECLFPLNLKDIHTLTNRNKLGCSQLLLLAMVDAFVLSPNANKFLEFWGPITDSEDSE